MKRTSFKFHPILLTLLILLVILPTAAFAIPSPASPPDIAPQVHYTFNLNYAPGGVYAQGDTTAGTFANVQAPPANPPRTGYEFGGWFLTPACTGTAAMATAGDTVAITVATDFYAKWTANVATVTFDSDGGTAVPNFVGAYDGLVTQPAAPMKAGYTFAGWYKESGLVNAWNFASDMLTGNRTLYAKWSGTGPGVDQEVVYFEWNRPGGGSYWQTAVLHDSAVSAPAAPTRAGYVFGGWYNESGTTTAYNFATLVDGGHDDHVHLYAKWTADIYTITYALDGGVRAPTSATVSYSGDTAPALTSGLLLQASKVGYAFGGWYYDAALTQAAVLGDSVHASKTLYAKWLNLYTVTFHRNDGVPSDILGFMSGITAGTTISTVTPAIVAAIGTRAGYTHDGNWYKDPACTTQFVVAAAPTGTPVVANMDVYVKWSVATSYTVTFDSQGGSAVAAQAISPVGPKTVARPVPAPTRAGYTFYNWSESLGGAAFAFTGETGAVVISSDKTLYANWVKNGAYRVVYTVDGAAYSSIDYTYGNTYSIPADPTKLGYTFNHWHNGGGDLRYSGDHILAPVTVFTDRTVTSNVQWDAQFTQNHYTVTFSTDRGIAPDSQPSLHYGNTVSTPAVPTADGYYLTGWYTSPNGAGTKWVFDGGASTVVTADMTLYANWVPTYTVTLDKGSSLSTLTPNNAIYGGASNWVIATNNVSNVPQGTKLVAPVYTPSGPNPTLTNYTFVGWFKDSLSGPQWTFGTATTGDTVTAHTTLFAKFVKRTVTVTLHPKNGSGAIVNTADFDTATVSVTNPSLPGFTFLGWVIHDDHTSADIAAGVGTTNVAIVGQANTTYFALWSKNDSTLKVVTYRNGYVGLDSTPAKDNILSTSAVVTGTVLNPLLANSRTGYTFNGWYNDVNGDGVINGGVDLPVAAPLTITADTNLVGSWTINTYAVTYDSQGGSAVAGLTVNYGATLTAPAAPIKPGYTFAGSWYKEAACTNAWTFVGGTTPDVVTGNTTLYAKWLNNYMVTFDKDGTTLKQVPDIADGSQIVSKGAGAGQAPVDPTKDGYSFAGWYTATSGGALFMGPGAVGSIAVSASITVYAQWTVDEAVLRTVTFLSAGGSYVAPVSVPLGGTVAAPTAPLRAGYVFNEWRIARGHPFHDEIAYVFTTPVTEHITLTATWRADLAVQVYSLDNATVGLAYKTPYNSTITAPVDPATSSNYAWDGKWYTSSGRTTQFTFATPVTTDLNLYPGRIAKYVVTLDPNFGTPTPPVQNLVAGSKVTQPSAPSRTGYMLDGWYVMTGITGTTVGAKWNFATDITPAAPLKLNAQWVMAYTVTFDPNYTGSVTTEVLSKYNQLISAPANPVRPGYGFEGWYTEPAGAGHKWDFSFDKLMTNTTLYADWGGSPSTVIKGVDRYDTAVKISQAGFAGGANAVVLAPGETFQQALCGAPLAAAWGGPVLLTVPDGLRAEVKNEIVRLAPTQVFVIGLSTATKNAVQAAVPGATVTAIATPTTSVYEMSLLVAQAVHAKLPALDTAIVAPGNIFADALGASPLAAAKGWPILLTPSSNTASALNSYAATAISTLGITKVVEVGTWTAIPVSTTRLIGTDRYDTSVRVALFAKANGASFAHLGIATGLLFPDALAAGPYLALDNGILLLSAPTAVPPVVSAAITAHKAEVTKVDFFAMVPPIPALIMGLLAP